MRLHTQVVKRFHTGIRKLNFEHKWNLANQRNQEKGTDQKLFNNTSYSKTCRCMRPSLHVGTWKLFSSLGHRDRIGESENPHAIRIHLPHQNMLNINASYPLEGTSSWSRWSNHMKQPYANRRRRRHRRRASAVLFALVAAVPEKS